MFVSPKKKATINSNAQQKLNWAEFTGFGKKKFNLAWAWARLSSKLTPYTAAEGKKSKNSKE